MWESGLANAIADEQRITHARGIERPIYETDIVHIVRLDASYRNVQSLSNFKYFTDLKSRLCLPESLAGDVDEPISIDRTKCKFIANYTSYQGEIMDRFQEEYDKGLTFSYTDYLLSKQSVNKAGYVQNVRNVGGQGLIIESVVYGLALDNKDATSLTGKFNSQCGSALGGVGKPARDLLTSNLFNP